MNRTALWKVGWPLLVVVALLPVGQWFLVGPVGDRFSSPIMMLSSVGQITGIIGLTLYSINLVLSTRLRIFESLFGGLNRVYIVHHVIGAVALVMLLIHPLLLALRLAPGSITAAAMFLVPQLSDLPTAYGILSLIGMIVLLVLTFFVTLPYRIWLWTHKVLGVAFFLAGLHVLLIPTDLYENAPLKFMMIAYVAVGLAAFTYRTLLPKLFIRRYSYIVKAASNLAPGVLQVDLIPQRRAMGFEAGQFVFASFRHRGVTAEWHPFSISSAPGDGSFSLTIKSLGSYTKGLADMAGNLVGAKVMVEGAYGRFSFRNFKSDSQVWIAGGIGVTPFLSMAQDLGRDFSVKSVDLYYSVRSENELIDVPLLQQAIAGAGQRLRVIPYVSDKKGRLTAKFIAEVSGDLATKDFLICGPPAMMHGLTDQLIGMGVKKSHIHSEEFSMS